MDKEKYRFQDQVANNLRDLLKWWLAIVYIHALLLRLETAGKKNVTF